MHRWKQYTCIYYHKWMTMNFVGQAKTRLRASLHKCCRLTNQFSSYPRERTNGVSQFKGATDYLQRHTCTLWKNCFVSLHTR